MMSLAAIARDPRCIYALDARNGGTVYSRIGGDGYPAPTLTMTNLSGNAGYFAEIDAAQASKLTTALDLSGFVDLSLTVDVSIPAGVANGKVIDLIAQGNGILANGGSGTSCLIDLFWLNSNIYCRFCGPLDLIQLKPLSGSRAVISITVSGRTVKMYVNGAMIAQTTLSADIPRTVANTGTVMLLNRQTIANNVAGVQLHAATIHAAALQAAEIQALSTIMRG